MIFNRPHFGDCYRVYSDIFIDGAGIHDGQVVHEWRDMLACSIALSDPLELKRYFGEGYDERPYAINILRKNGRAHTITLFGQGREKTMRTGLAINHYSGRKLIDKDLIDGGTIPAAVLVSLLLLSAALMALALF